MISVVTLIMVDDRFRHDGLKNMDPEQTRCHPATVSSNWFLEPLAPAASSFNLAEHLLYYISEFTYIFMSFLSESKM